MSLQIKTDRELDELEEMRYLTYTEVDNLSFLVFRSNYHSYFPFSYRDKTDGERFSGYAGAVDNQDEKDIFPYSSSRFVHGVILPPTGVG